MISDFLLEAVHILPVRTFASVGFDTVVALTNDSQMTGDVYVTDYLIQARVYSPDGRLTHTYRDKEPLLPGSKRSVRVSTLDGIETDQDQVVMFSLIPVRLLARSKDGISCDVQFEELRALVNVQGHLIEYRRPDGYSTGVLYSSPSFNYKKFHKETPTTLLQAPKIFLSSTLDTIVTLTNPSADPTYQQAQEVMCSVTTDAGEIIASWVETIPAFTTKAISVKEALQKVGKVFDSSDISFYCFSSFSKLGFAFPLIFARNSAANTLAVEHTFGPWSYASYVGGPLRRSIDREFLESDLFKDIRS